MFESAYADLQGTVTAHAIQGVAGSNPPPASIIRTNEAWRVHLEWKTEGLAAEVQAGRFQVSVYLESIGPGPDLKLPIVPGPNQQGVDLLVGVLTDLGGAAPFFRRDYSMDIDVAASTVPVDPNGSRAYKLVTAITYDTPAGHPGPMAAFQEGPVLQFYTP